MLSENEKENIIEVMKERILSPVVYTLDDSDTIELICFLDGNVTVKDVFDTECALNAVTGKTCKISDIRQFSEPERIYVLHSSNMLYSENRKIKTVFEYAITHDYIAMLKENEETVKRYDETSSPYLN